MDPKDRMTGLLKWVGSITGLAGATLIAANVQGSGWGFALFLASSLAWMAAAHRMRELSLLILNAGFTAANILGVCRWLL